MGWRYIAARFQWKGRDPSLSIGFALFSEWNKGMRYYRTIFPSASLIIARVFPISSLAFSLRELTNKSDEYL